MDILGLIAVLAIPFITPAQNKQYAVPGDIESYIDRFKENENDKNKNGWAHYYIPKGMADTLTVKCRVYMLVLKHIRHILILKMKHFTL
jgi:hypothetical protein